MESSFIYSLIHSVIFVGYLLHDGLWTEQRQESLFENETNTFKNRGVCVCVRDGGTQVEGVGVTQGGSSLGFMTNSDSGRATSFSVFSSLKGRRRNRLDPSSAGLQRL